MSLSAVAGTPAVQLFAERAQAVQSGFHLEPSNAIVVSAICRRLDGIPLAIELAAARMLLLSPAALLGRLERRLPVLALGASDLPERQQTLRHTLTGATICWVLAPSCCSSGGGLCWRLHA